MRSVLTAILATMSIGAWADGRVAIADMANGKIEVVGDVAASGQATVTLKVTPNADYYITLDDITVSKTTGSAQAPRRTPGYTDQLTVSEVTVDNTGEGTYKFTLPEGYGAYVQATFTPCIAMTLTVSIDNWYLGGIAAEPKVEGNVGGGQVTYTYAKKGSTEFTADVPTELGSYTVKASVPRTGHYLAAEATADFTIAKAGEDIDAEDTDTGKDVDNVTVSGTVIDAEKKLMVIDELIIPASAAGENLTVFIPEMIGEFTVVGITPDAFKDKKVTDIYMPDTKTPLTIEDGAVPTTATIHTTLALLDDYALMNSLKANYEAQKVVATAKAPDLFWTFSSGIDATLPADLTAYIVYIEDGAIRYVEITEEQLKLNDGSRGIKSNNGVLLGGEKGKDYDFVAVPGRLKSGTKPAETDAKDYGQENRLEPVINGKNYPADSYAILNGNQFHSIKANESEVSACKAVLKLK